MMDITKVIRIGINLILFYPNICIFPELISTGDSHPLPPKARIIGCSPSAKCPPLSRGLSEDQEGCHAAL